jgi:hypothetical protein
MLWLRLIGSIVLGISVIAIAYYVIEVVPNTPAVDVESTTTTESSSSTPTTVESSSGSETTTTTTELSSVPPVVPGPLY